MGAFKIEILGVGGHGCERRAGPGDKLHGRCGRMTCPDCLAFDFVQMLRQKGMIREGDTAIGQELADDEEPPAGAEVYYTNAEHQIVPEAVEGGKRYWQIKQHATLTHWPLSKTEIRDDLLRNERTSGKF